MTEAYPILAGAEAWSASDAGSSARTGLLVLHGFTGNPCSVRPLGEALAERGFNVELPRLPGHGTHYKDLATTRYADWYAEVERARHKLRAISRRVVVVGFSMGGTLGLDLTSQHPDIAGLVAINTPLLEREGLLPKLAPYLERILPIVPASAAGLRKDDIAKPGQTENAYDKVPAAAGNSLLRELPRIREQVARITCPVLVAYSANDHSVSPDNSRALLKMLRSSDVSELVLERSFHVAPLDYDFELLVERISAFATRIP